MSPNNSFKANLLRYTNNMAERACHVVGSATQVGLTQALEPMEESVAELEIEIALLPFAAQKRSGYRPNHKHPLAGEFFLGHITFHDGHVDPGTTARALVRLLARSEQIDSLLQFGSWTIWEGASHVGSARVIGLGSNNSFKPKPLRGSA